MKICVLVKQVPDKNDEIKLDQSQQAVDKNNFNFITNESDNYAVEEALLIKEKIGGEVVVCTFGDESSIQVVKDALSKGADRGIFIENNSNEDYDILNISKIFKSVFNEENFDLILSGLQSDDIGNGQLGVLMAEHLNMSHGSLVMQTESSDNTKIKVKRELENGWFQWSELELPASLTIQSGINKPRYASLRGIMMMKKKPIKTVKLSEVDTNAEKIENLKSMYIPQKTKETVRVDGTPDEIAEKLHNILKNDLGLL
ncbi:MAG: electron transfer flavoprotein subunit beta [Candidatus Marinimicrobia bacterium]|nr:electron transfer flavoprotein subunit beta [Candidatus Neomarinimicrobiota bacterium]|tara:strand:- start:17 stop:790 length:774 start_codon:yes stop_codon:yes gene_type:complete